jgi:hypothetical protein
VLSGAGGVAKYKIEPKVEARQDATGCDRLFICARQYFPGKYTKIEESVLIVRSRVVELGM